MSQSRKEKVCIKTRKVFDWVTRPVDLPLISVNNDDLDKIFECEDKAEDICKFLQKKGQTRDVTVNCFLSDKDGDRIDPNEKSKSFLCMEISPLDKRQDVTVNLPNGDEVTLQKVKVLVKGFVTVELLDANDMVLCESEPIPFATAQTFILCAPDGTELDCHVNFFECDATLVCTDVFSQLDVSISFCLDIQMEADVKLEVEAKICKPREELTEAINVCDNRKFPPQCPEVFPVH
ncbi:hypothetical protein [Bacillus sp. V2I10]|uniref:hypothetical protein n=1 Tax=Bacillus sp. V2I10 TaxID=3042276 RepID=UPI00278833AF|nr:hypothetical protein [Bacillus sp. V2I10]MDQ0861156.1 hypothetical protein [Bacillus sp. V2I10]